MQCDKALSHISSPLGPNRNFILNFTREEPVAQKDLSGLA